MAENDVERAKAAAADAHLTRAQAMLDNAGPDEIAVANARVEVADQSVAVAEGAPGTTQG